MGILYTEGRTDAQASEAEKVMHVLTTAYPGHPWAVRVDNGIIFIRHLAFGTNWGMNLRTSAVDHDAAVLRKKIVLLAGEWLERAGFRRGRSEEQPAGFVEGVPLSGQAPAVKPAADEQMQIQVAAPEPLRTEPRPQALKEDVH